MCRRVIGSDRSPTLVIDCEFHRQVALEHAGFNSTKMYEQIADPLLSAVHLKAHIIRVNDASVPDLSSGLGIKRRLVEHDDPLLAGHQAINFLAVADQRKDYSFGNLRLVTQELCRADPLA